MAIRNWYVLPFILLSVVVAVYSGWQRIGWNFPGNAATAHHGSIMVGSFLSTLIFFERAVTFKNKMVLWLPIINGLSILFYILEEPLMAQCCLLIGSIGFCIMCLYFISAFKEYYYYIFFAGAFCLFIGNWLLIRNSFYPQVVPWWMGFFLFTIVAERLELTKFLIIKKSIINLLTGILVLSFLGLIIPFHLYGREMFSVGLILCALWLLKYDMAFKSLKKPGQHRYSAGLLITGYFWLIVTGVAFLAGDVNAFWYDAALHSFFIGFVMSMIFSHAPIILPGVLRLPVKPYRPFLYTWFIALHISLITRIIADAFMWIEVRRVAGLINGIVIFAFFITMAIIVKSELNKRKRGLAV